jgi:hypothetical protein
MTHRPVTGTTAENYTLGPITAEVFALSTCYLVPMLFSVEPGSGTLDAFLDALRAELPDKPIIFVNVINARLKPRLQARGFGLLNLDEQPLMKVT